MSEIAEFPYRTWPRIGRREARALRAWAAAGPLGELARGAGGLAPLLGAPLRLDAAPRWDRDAPLPPEADVPTALLEGPGRAALTLSPGLASALVARALGAATPEEGAGPLRELERGVLAYVIARWLADSRWGVVAVLGHPAPIPPVALRWPLSVQLEAARYAVDLWLPERAPRTPPPWRLTLGRVPAPSRAVAGHATLGRAEVEALSAGDVLVPDAIGVDRDGRGAVRLRVAHRAWRASGDPRGYRLEAELTGEQEEQMTDIDEALGEGAQGARITLQVELARPTVTLGELATLDVGAVLPTGRPIGGEVVLRAEGEPVAYGELVDVEGEVGVRILRLAGS